MHFADEAEINVKAGKGGDGCMSFRREKFVERGGPDGGNGGYGGSIIFEADGNLNTLVNFVSKKHFEAKKGTQGMGKNMAGKDGEDILLKVPMGTLIYDKIDNSLIADLTRHGQQVIVARGGIGGKGNANFVSSIRRSPDFAEVGEPGEEKDLRLELKLIADVAIIGYPSVGKSTLISRISNARPKIADYPFTTLVPNLGVVNVDKTDFLVADIPGLIEGAHEGKGLGIEFLRHIERTKILVHILDVNHENLRDEYNKLNEELKLYSNELAKKPQLLVINKTDTTIPEIIDEIKKEFKKEKPIFISAVTGEGIDKFLYKLKDEVVKLRTKKVSDSTTKIAKKVFRPHLDLPDTKQYTIEKTDDGFRIIGKRIEQLAIMTDMSKRGGIFRMHDILNKIGVYKKIINMGAKTGDKIYIGERIFDFTEID
ncbi:GTPase ObgE [Candidatus Peregrinibacteria bacterium]|nr:GTPase ObgE [Candidatus Peregrinibacteria bacterium]